MSTAGPPVSVLVGFQELRECKIGTKVRFLGCVSGYNTATGVVTLKHKYPDTNGSLALVDVNLLLETLKPADTRIGEWMNVIGYVTKQEDGQSSSKQYTHAASVQAVIYWSAGRFNPTEYKDAVAEM